MERSKTISIRRTAGVAAGSWMVLSLQACCQGSCQRFSPHSGECLASFVWWPAALPELCSCRSPPSPPSDWHHEPPPHLVCSQWCERSSPVGGSAASCNSAARRSHPGQWYVRSPKGLSKPGLDTYDKDSSQHHQPLTDKHKQDGLALSHLYTLCLKTHDIVGRD